MSMLSGLAEYIFGSAASAEDPSASEDGGQGSRPSSSMQLTYADDDWVLVDVTSRLSNCLLFNVTDLELCQDQAPFCHGLGAPIKFQAFPLPAKPLGEKKTQNMFSVPARLVFLEPASFYQKSGR